MANDGAKATCKNCNTSIAYDGPCEDWFHTDRDSSPADLWCSEDTTVNADRAVPESPMKLERVYELREELEAERISYGELAEIESAFEGLGIVPDEGMMASDMLDVLETKEMQA